MTFQPHENQDPERAPNSSILFCLNAYAVSKNILSGNCVQLRQLLHTLEDPNDPAEIWIWENREKRDSLLGEVTRHFHNFLTSVTTLIDHTRNLMKEDFITDKHREEHLQAIRESFAGLPLAIFIKELRHFITHRTVPIIQMAHTIEKNKESRSMDLDLERMASWDKWSPPARLFIQKHKPAIRMLDLINDYERFALAFHQAFVRRFFSHYNSQIRSELSSSGVTPA